MIRTASLLFASLSIVALVGIPGNLHAEDAISDLPPYKLVRSLEYVQDTIARGDLSALDMQKYLLGAIDDRLKKSTQKDFDDPRNVDAALIYAMSGGNSDTLAALVFNDASGHFDIRITEALRMYLNGKSDAAVKRLEEMVPEYKTTAIGPYLALVAANSIAPTSAQDALKYFDWARLASPGSIIEETALRRSVALSIKAEKFDKAIAYAKRYARRFILSPYAGQFADVFVSLAVDHSKEVTEEQIAEVMQQMEPSRQREVYLRMARKAALVGKLELAKFCAEQAKGLLDSNSENSAILAELYSGMVKVPSGDVLDAMKAISAIPDDKLSDKDRKLRDAAKFIAQEMVSLPETTSLTQADADKVIPVSDGQDAQISTDDPTAAPPKGIENPLPTANEVAPVAGAPAVPNQAANAGTGEAKTAGEVAMPQDAQPPSELDIFVAGGRAKLDEIDAMLKKEQ